jgi:hypothetical protein
LDHILHHEPASDETKKASHHHGKRGDHKSAMQNPLVGQPAMSRWRNRVTQCEDEVNVDRNGQSDGKWFGDDDDDGIEWPGVEKEKNPAK